MSFLPRSLKLWGNLSPCILNGNREEVGLNFMDACFKLFVFFIQLPKLVAEGSCQCISTALCFQWKLGAFHPRFTHSWLFRLYLIINVLVCFSLLFWGEKLYTQLCMYIPQSLLVSPLQKSWIFLCPSQELSYHTRFPQTPISTNLHPNLLL